MNIKKNRCQRRCILLIDDDPDIHNLIGGILGSKQVEIISTYDGEHALTVARRARPDLILLDYEMPGKNGIEVLKTLRNEVDTASIPVIFITGNDSHKVLTQCFQAGANDYIRKPFCAPELRARTRALLDRKQLQDELEQFSLQDELTGLHNRASISRQIQNAVEFSTDGDFALLYLDLDRFQLVNNCLGHKLGDQLLQQISQRLLDSLRNVDMISQVAERATAARIGGDEFVILLEGLSTSKDAVWAAECLLDTLSEAYLLAGQSVCCTASIGILIGNPSYIDAQAVLRDADFAMYEAKAAGKGGCAVFDPSMKVRAERRLRIEGDLRTAINREELFVLYQPIVSLETGWPIAFEALLRMNHPLHGTIAPADFLPVAEETGLIIPMEAWVLDRACRDFANWQLALGDLAPKSIHVNLSRQQLLHRDLTQLVKFVLKKYQIAPACLQLEIAESEIMCNPRIAAAMLGELRQLGVKIGMDAFGTGNSSLASLQEIAVDLLKIDRSFIAKLGLNASISAVVQAVIRLGQDLGLTTIAEGIENEEQLANLRRMGCQLGQGYFFAKPMPAKSISGFLQSGAKPEYIVNTPPLVTDCDGTATVLELATN